MNKRVIKSIVCGLIVCVILFFGYRFADRQFRLVNIEVQWKEQSLKISPDEEARFTPIFTQPFHYLDRGRQSYVFLSQNGQYILKFFDTRCLHSGSYPLLAPVSKKRCAKKLERLVEGYRTAWRYDRFYTGLIYAQFAPNPLNPFKVIAYDRFGFKHEIDLAKVPFVLQERAVPTREVITDLLNKGDVNGAIKRLQTLKRMYIAEYAKGIADLDRNMMYNTGFVGNRPVRFDAGRLFLDKEMADPAHHQEELDKVFVGRVGEWLDRHFPRYKQEIIDSL